MSALAHIVHLLVAILVLGLVSAAPAPTAFSENQKVEVREGDTWSPATVVKKEGRRYLIHYEGAQGSEDEWVTAERIRIPGAPASPGAAPAPAPEATPAPAAKPVQWLVGQKVEVKWGGMWSAATITNRRGEWYLVTYAQGGSREWVEPWRIRKVGSTEDKVGHAQPNPSFFPGRAVGNPPAPTPKPAPKTFGAAEDPSEQNKEFESDPAYKAADTSAARSLELNPGSGEFKLTLDPAAKAIKGPARPIFLRGSGGFFDMPAAVVIPRSAPTIAFVNHMDSAPGEAAPARIEKVDLATGTSIAVVPIGPGMLLMDAAPDGSVVLLRSNGGLGKNDRIEVWTIVPKAEKKMLMLPYGDQPWHARDVEFAMMVDGGHVLTIGRNERIDLWEIASGKSIYSGKVPWSTKPTISPGGKYLALAAEKHVLFLDPLKGTVLTSIPIDVPSAELGFSPSGKQLVALSGGTVYAWDLATGALSRQFNTRTTGSRISMPADDYALVDEITLVDIQRRIAFWQYELREGKARLTPDGRYWYVKRADRQARATLASFDVLNPQALAAAKAVNPDDVLLLKPGSKVAIVNNVAVDEKDRQQITADLTRIAQANGWVVDDAAPVRLVASNEPGKSEERSYRRFGDPPFSSTKVTVTPQISKLVVEHEGKIAWQSQTVSGAGFMLSIKENQSIEDAVAQATKPNPLFFRSVKIPTHITKPRDPEYLGTTPLP